ncbi:MAG: Acylneuraminate cytidylyltransferase [uncultured bacterium]|uniref:Post-translational flagellin modification protein B n=1 Tax=Candidatus Daviesbacteria bacterium GW2011_GWC2_40_12 TaxID=1618431 RepID=A0A0G0QQG7_9BACT|nr:MAG: Acylneuraminate cytidylyltransferase [uncultured bacterium]KKQ83685.1 MAG: Post-translational flagellin modification protein B [Candidatus Daviesbacteria bacterium GW2011_GWF2_38_7]KKR17270.1 MAG: Post-translational flagellin modification protein B [Candidatus Daviesbacteria bacterium GW2011_GWA2_39_33]KKR24446.1 MAG: Post-translational flagellin modification protein B [Candidatus Daviesbacteria bacterium GW2011_GWB1_39_5]KKR42669.1 MAG: Post-translational flagellin modification protein
MNNILITICARGGSKGVKGKNIREILGKPLIYYTIKQAKEWSKDTRIIVSTDSEEIAVFARQFGAEVPFIRPAALATDTAAKVPVLRHALNYCEEFYKEKYDCVMDLDVTSPVRKISDLENSLKLFTKKNPKTLFSVVPAHRNPYFNMVEETNDGKAVLSKKGDFVRRQDAPKVYDMNASIYIYDRDYLINEENNSSISDNSIVYVMNEISKDIDSETDFRFIEFLVKEGIISL